jgi:hypothetical protein
MMGMAVKIILTDEKLKIGKVIAHLTAAMTVAILSGFALEEYVHNKKMLWALNGLSGYMALHIIAWAESAVKARLQGELNKVEKAAGIANPKDFRNEVVKFCLRARANNNGRNPSWTSYEKIREVIEKRMFSQVEDLLPVISFGSKRDSESERKHADFVERMVARGYTERQVRRLVEWYMRVKQSA